MWWIPYNTALNSELPTWPFKSEGWHTSGAHGTIDEIPTLIFLERGIIWLVQGFYL